MGTGFASRVAAESTDRLGKGDGALPGSESPVQPLIVSSSIEAATPPTRGPGLLRCWFKIYVTLLAVGCA
ncbi:MAG TPA: hypothetical protein VK204_03075 [Nocardioidaceae bacterium]|nr:hypothetical protein [Nocardioidaceae bacterium]